MSNPPDDPAADSSAGASDEQPVAQPAAESPVQPEAESPEQPVAEPPAQATGQQPTPPPASQPGQQYPAGPYPPAQYPAGQYPPGAYPPGAYGQAAYAAQPAAKPLGVGAGAGIGCGAHVLALFVAMGLLSVGGVTGFFVPFVLIAVAAIVMMFFPKTRRFATGVLIIVAAVWIIVLGPCLGMMTQH